MAVSNLYCSRSDVAQRLPLGAIISPTGIVASSVAATDTIMFDGHGLENDDAVNVRAVEGGTLSAPLASGVTYYAKRLSNSTFQLAATPGGAAINLTTDGASMVITREPIFDDIIEFYSRWADAFFPAHLVPFTAPVPVIVKGLVAELAAKRLLNIGGQDSAVVNATELAAKAQLERYLTNGMPIREAAATPSANRAIASTLSSTSDPRGWGSGRLP